MRVTKKCLCKYSHSSCTCNGDHVGLLIKTGSIQKECHKLPFVTYRSVRKRVQNVVQIDGVAQMVVGLTIKEKSYLVVGLFDDLVAPLLY